MNAAIKLHLDDLSRANAETLSEQDLLSLHRLTHPLWGDAVNKDRNLITRAHRIVRREMLCRGLNHNQADSLDATRKMADDLAAETELFLEWWACAKSAIMTEARLQGKLDNLFGDLFKSLKRKLEKQGYTASNEHLVSEWRQEAVGAYQTALSSGVTDAANAAYGIVNAGFGLDITKLPDQIAERLQDKLFTGCENTMNRISGQVEEKLLECYNNGLGIDEAARQLRDEVFDGLQTWEAERVARTEIQGAQNYANHYSIAEHADYEQWLTAEDDRVRDSHVDLHGQITKPGDPFSNGLLYPGDPAGDAEEIIDCRCYTRSFNMPEGMIAPLGMDQFYEEDLIDVTPAEEKAA